MSKVRCELCTEDYPAEEILDHLRVMHPEKGAEPLATWPDGEAVIVDHTLKPSDFGGESEQ